MAITNEAIVLTLEYWKTVWDKIEVLTADEAQKIAKVPIVEVEPEKRQLRSTAFFAYNEANFSIAKVRTYAGATLIAENVVNIVKTNRQSLTLIRKDFLS